MAEMNCGMNMKNPGMQPTGAGWDRRAGMGQQTAGWGQRPGSWNSLMKRLNEASFAVDDAGLYLDTHPNDKDAIRYFQNALAQRKNAMDAYESQYGPLFIDDSSGGCWNWVTEKWPWEGGY